jgi:hypothetical protein
MKTYQETIWKLALSKANSYYSGDMVPRAEGVDTVAWVFDVTPNIVHEDIDKVYPDAMKKSMNG